MYIWHIRHESKPTTTGLKTMGQGEIHHRQLGVLIGGSGLIGGTLVHYFKTKERCTIEVRAPSSKKLSIRSEEDIRHYLIKNKPDFIINSAIANINSDSQMSYEVNYLGTLNLARAAAALGVPYIHISSAAALPNGENLDEGDTLPITPKLSNYAKSKLMAEETLRYMAKHEGLDYSCVRLAIVYGNHDHKIQGFHRLFFSVADESMPFLFTRKETYHSYSNSRKLPYFVHHMLKHRDEFSGKTYHFVDKDPVELANLILTIKSFLNLSTPKEIYIPYQLASMGKKGLAVLLRILRKFGLKATLPPELIFLDSFYKTQTLSARRLLDSSFVDPLPDETIFTRLPDLVVYYLTRWSHQNLITTYDENLTDSLCIDEDFQKKPLELLESIHGEATRPFHDLLSPGQN